MAYKITPSLYYSWLFYTKPLFDRTDEQEVEARAEFMDTLRKVHKPDTPEQERGHIFENTIEYIATGKCNPQYSTLCDKMKEYGIRYFTTDSEKDPETYCAKEIAYMCRDGVFQEKDGRELPSGNYIYGVADCILPTTIFDFKRVSAYEMGKYQQSIQHLAYMYIWDSKRFDYLICDGSAEPFDEVYTWDDNSLALLESRIALMVSSICGDPELRALFDEHWRYKK